MCSGTGWREGFRQAAVKMVLGHCPGLVAPCPIPVKRDPDCARYPFAGRSGKSMPHGHLNPDHGAKLVLKKERGALFWPLPPFESAPPWRSTEEHKITKLRCLRGTF